MTFEHNLSDLKTLSVTSFAEMFVLLDKNMEPLCNSISYDDSRGTEEAAMIASEFGSDKIYQITGAPLHPMYSLPKLMWVKKHMADVYKKTEKICSFADFILLKFGAEPHMDYSLAARTMLFDVKNKCWSKEILNFANIDENFWGVPLHQAQLSAGYGREN